MGRRVGAATAVLAFLCGVRIFAGSAETRAAWLYLVALPIGYGHLIGGLWFARRRIGQRLPQGLPRGFAAAFALLSLANLLAAYSWLLHTPPLLAWVLVPLLLVSAWHIVENDVALGAAYGRGLELGAVHGQPHCGAIVLGATALIGAAALLTPSGAQAAALWFGWPLPALACFTLDELATAVLLYHAVSWLRFFWDRSRLLARRDREAAARLRRRLIALHGLPLLLNALLYLFVPSLHSYVASPALYLFWSVLHAFQTAWVRSRRATLATTAAA